MCQETRGTVASGASEWGRIAIRYEDRPASAKGTGDETLLHRLTYGYYDGSHRTYDHGSLPDGGGHQRPTKRLSRTDVCQQISHDRQCYSSHWLFSLWHRSRCPVKHLDWGKLRVEVSKRLYRSRTQRLGSGSSTTRCLARCPHQWSIGRQDLSKVQYHGRGIRMSYSILFDHKLTP